MSRGASLVFAALLLGGCRTTADRDLGTSGDSLVDPEAQPDDRSSSSRSPNAGTEERSGSATSLIAVAAVEAGGAQPCERMCGSLGDCLFADATYSTSAAGGLELKCLDLCVHSPDAEPAKAEFLACGTESECGQLQACAQRTWAALASARKGPEVGGISSSDASPCQEGCRWVYSCIAGAPPGQIELDPQAYRDMENCEKQCETTDVSDRDYMAKLAPCLANHCSLDGLWHCFEEANK